MTAEQYDLIVIGAGSAARDAAKKAATEHGARVALVEHERWGGSCPGEKEALVFRRPSDAVSGVGPTDQMLRPE